MHFISLDKKKKKIKLSLLKILSRITVKKKKILGATIDNRLLCRIK